MAGEIKHEWIGTTLVITSDSGTSSCNLKGRVGDIGPRGPQGPCGVVYDANGNVITTYVTTAYFESVVASLVARIEALEQGSDDDDTGNEGGGGGSGEISTTAILGLAKLGYMKLGDKGEPILKLSAPIIRLVTGEAEEPVITKLSAPTIRLVEQGEEEPIVTKLAAPVIKLVESSEEEPVITKLTTPIIRLETECTHTNYTSKITKAANCTEDGIRTHTCSNCGYSWTETIEAIGHVWTNAYYSDEFTTTGFGRKCTVCGELVNETPLVSTPVLEITTKSNGANYLVCNFDEEVSNDYPYTFVFNDANGEVVKVGSVSSSYSLPAIFNNFANYGITAGVEYSIYVYVTTTSATTGLVTTSPNSNTVRYIYNEDGSGYIPTDTPKLDAPIIRLEIVPEDNEEETINHTWGEPYYISSSSTKWAHECETCGLIEETENPYEAPVLELTDFGAQTHPDDNVYLGWQAIEGAEHYEIRVADSSGNRLYPSITEYGTGYRLMDALDAISDMTTGVPYTFTVVGYMGVSSENYIIYTPESNAITYTFTET